MKALEKDNPIAIAEFLIRVAGTVPNPEMIKSQYVNMSETFKRDAAKAKAHKTGKYRGYTEAALLERSAAFARLAPLIAYELQKRIA